jgi:hypothetical protein
MPQDFTVGQVLTAAQMDTLSGAVDGYATTATAAGTTTLTTASMYQQFFTGSTTQTVTMPVASTLYVGQKWRVVNNSSGVVTVQSSGANTIYAVPAGGDVIFTCILASGTSAASWDYKNATLAGGGGKILQVVYASSATSTAIATTTYTDTTLTASITPSANTSRVMVLVQQPIEYTRSSASQGVGIQILRGASVIFLPTPGRYEAAYMATTTSPDNIAVIPLHYVDSPATSSATTYKTQAAPFATASGGSITAQPNSAISTMILLEIGA